MRWPRMQKLLLLLGLLLLLLSVFDDATEVDVRWSNRGSIEVIDDEMVIEFQFPVLNVCSASRHRPIYYVISCSVFSS